MRGDIGLPTDGVRRVFPNDTECWKYDQGKARAYNYHGNRTSDWEATRGGVTDDESRINARLDDHLKDSEMESEVKNPWHAV